MAKYRKKPIAVEAWQWNGQEIPLAYPSDKRIYVGGESDGQPYLVVHTQHGVATARLGDWVLYGPNGEVYPCAKETFAETYEPVTDE